jgi:hypothetical protein
LRTASGVLFSFEFSFPFFQLIDEFPGFAHNPFEKQEVGACFFKKEFRANPRKVSSNMKRGIALAGFERI